MHKNIKTRNEHVIPAMTRYTSVFFVRAAFSTTVLGLFCWCSAESNRKRSTQISVYTKTKMEPLKNYFLRHFFSLGESSGFLGANDSAYVSCTQFACATCSFVWAQLLVTQLSQLMFWIVLEHALCFIPLMMASIAFFDQQQHKQHEHQHQHQHQQQQ